MRIDKRYGVKIGKKFASWGTQDLNKAHRVAKYLGGTVVDYAEIGRQLEDLGHKVIYNY